MSSPMLLPHRNCATSSEKWLQLCCSRSYFSAEKSGARSARNSRKSSSGISVSPRSMVRHTGIPRLRAKNDGSSDCMPPEKYHSRPNATMPVWGTMSSWAPSSCVDSWRAMPMLRS
eukprot:1469802-Prymnesium_polylepis.1